MSYNITKELNKFEQIFSEVKIESVKKMEGAENYILEINDSYICKIPKDLNLNNLDLERHLLLMLDNKFKTNIPKVLYYEKNFLVYKKIIGTELTNEIYDKLTVEQQDKLAYDIAYFLFELHNSLDIKVAKSIGLKQTGWPWSCKKLKANMQLLRDPILINIFNCFISCYEESSSNIQIKLIHNDMILRNIIVDPCHGQLTGIIDFTDAAIDDFYFDLRLNYMSIPKLSEEIAWHYSKFSKIKLDLKKIYLYYIATEFSRYFEKIQKAESSNLEMIKLRIMTAYNNLKINKFF